MSDLATLAIKIENGDVVKATTSLDSLTVAGGKSEAATQRLTRRMALLEIEARNMDAAMKRGGAAMNALEIEARQMDAALERDRRAMALLEIEARKMDAAMSKSVFSVSGLATKMGASEAAAARLSTAVGALSAVMVVGFIGRKTIEETEAAQAAMAQLEAAVASTGGVAGRTVAELDALSMSLQRQTTFSDEAVKGAEAMLLTFDKIRGAEFDRATQAVTDLATRMGGDLQGAAVQVGKALQDPATGLTALRRSGVSFSAAQIEVIKNLYETGRAAEGQRVILKELEHQFGGSAAAARDTLGGALAGLKNAWGDLFEVTKGASVGTVNAINGITHALESSGLSMNKILHDATVDWETMRASIEKVRTIMSLPIGPGFLDRARAAIQRIDFDLNAKIAELNAPAKIGPAVKPPPITIDVDTKQAKKDLDELQKATDSYYNSLNQHQIAALKAASGMRAQNAATREMIEATKEGPAAVEALTIAQAGANAVRELGVGVSEKAAAAVRREAEEQARLAIELGHVQQSQQDAAAAAKQAADEAARVIEHRWRDAARVLSSTINGVFTDILNKKNPFQAIWDNAKAGFFKMVSDILASKITDKFKEMLGVGPTVAAKKQDEAGRKMVEASQRQLRAAEIMAGIVPTEGTPGRGGGIVIEDVQKRRIPEWITKTFDFVKAHAAQAAAGFGVGYGVGQATYSDSHGTTGNYARGALGGAASGAIAGSAFGPIGSAVGAVAGFIGGILGTNKAMKEAAKAMTEAVGSVTRSIDALKARNNNDALAGAIAQVEEQRVAMAKAIEDAWSGGDANSDRVRWRTQKLKEMNAAQDEYINQLKMEAALKQTRQLEDYQQRTLAATPGMEKQAAARALDLAQQRERQDLITSFGSEIDAREQATLAALDQALAAEKQKAATEGATRAMEAFTTSVNTVTGFKLNDLQPYLQRFSEGRPTPGTMPSSSFPLPVNPFVPPTQPLAQTQLSQTGTTRSGSMSITIAPGAIVVNESKTPEMTADAIMNAVLTKVDQERNASGGLSSARSAAFDRMKLRPGAVQWRS